MLRLLIGIPVLLFGITGFSVAITNIPPGAEFQYILGMILPSSVLITGGILILAFRRGPRPDNTKNGDEES